MGIVETGNIVKAMTIPIHERESPGEECGVFGIYFPHRDFRTHIVKATLSGAMTLQHRGEESAGFVVADGEKVFEPFKKMGWLNHLFAEYNETIKTSPQQERQGYIAITHNRYSTTGSSNEVNAGPFNAESSLGTIAVSHNGNVTNASQIREHLQSKGHVFKSTTDSEVIAELIADSPGKNWEKKITFALRQLEGSYSLTMCTKDGLYGARDPIGNRPLSLAEFKEDGIVGYALSSETTSFTKLNINYKKDVAPGELVSIDSLGVRSTQYVDELPEQAFCGLELVYGMRDDSRIGRTQLKTLRQFLGAQLAQLYPPPPTIDFVTYIPESAKTAAEGYATQLSKMWRKEVPMITTLLKGRYGSINGGIRGFINPDNAVRQEIAAKNYYPFDQLQDARIVVIDDSIFRGNTTSGVIKIMKNNAEFLNNSGAKEIHLRISFPEVFVVS